MLEALESLDLGFRALQAAQCGCWETAELSLQSSIPYFLRQDLSRNLKLIDL